MGIECKQEVSVMNKYILKNGIILDGSENMKPYKADIFVNNGIIEDIITNGKSPSECSEIDLDGKYIMPGLINMHVHLAGNGKPQKKQRDNEKLVKKVFATPIGRFAATKLVENYAKIELMSGVTTIRTVGGLRDLDTKTRDKINKGLLDGPRIIASNEAISVPGGHMAGSVAVACHNPEEAIAQIEKLKGEKVNLIKLMITGGVMDAKEKGVPGQMKMSPEIIKACCDKAHEYGFIVSAHVESQEGVKIALENGVDSIEHGSVMDDECIELFKKHNAFMICTVSPGIPYALFDQSVSHTSDVEKFNGELVLNGFTEGAKTCLKNNIPVGLGNDVGCPWIAQYDFYRELVYFHKYVGATNTQALHTATLVNAKLAGIDKETGSIEKGKCADLIVCKNNPLDNLNNLRKVDMVIARGKVYGNPKVKRNAYVDCYLDEYMN